MNDRALYELTKEQQDMAIEVMNVIVKPSLSTVSEVMRMACEAKDVPPIVFFTALCAEALLLAAYTHASAFGTTESFVQMARSAIEHAAARPKEVCH